MQFELERVPCSIGTMLLITDREACVRALDWSDYEPRMHRLLDLHYGAKRWSLRARTEPSHARAELERYLAGELTAIDGLRVETGGTPFQREVWARLRAIPAGSTATYGQLAHELGRPTSARAVGMANGANPVGVVVPCHRVIGANASLTGYAGGLDRKRWLLAHERGHAPASALSE